MAVYFFLKLRRFQQKRNSCKFSIAFLALNQQEFYKIKQVIRPWYLPNESVFVHNTLRKKDSFACKDVKTIFRFILTKKENNYQLCWFVKMDGVRFLFQIHKHSLLWSFFLKVKEMSAAAVCLFYYFISNILKFLSNIFFFVLLYSF